jgi:hypothetical protein
VTVTVADNLLTDKVIIPEEFMWESNGNNTSTLVLSSDQDIVLKDWEPYTYTKTTAVKSVKYIRRLTNNDVNKYRPWYVPTDYKITAEDTQNITFYKINLIANAAEGGGEVTDESKIWVYLVKLNPGDILYANRPYVFVSTTAGEFEFNVEEDAKIYAPNNTSRLNNSTSAYNYDFYGTYVQGTVTGYDIYYIGSKGSISRPANDVKTINQYRWYIKATPKDNGGNYAPVFVFSEVDDETGISQKDNVVTEESYYNLSGMRINKPARGTYIIKYSDGSVKKVAVK